jgi:hypothetical protein
MTKKTERPRNYAKLTEALSVKPSIMANKRYENGVNPLVDPRVASIAILKQKSDEINTPNLLGGKQSQEGLMVFAVLYCFGLKSGVGANTLSLFFKIIRI